MFMTIDATFWVAISFLIFFGGLIYLKVPQKLNNSLDTQIKQMKKVGGVSGMLTMLPGVSKAQKAMAEKNISDDILIKQLAIISSMTLKEKKHPEIIKASRKIRISKGSGTKVQDVNKLLKQFLQSQKMLKRMKNMGGGQNPSSLLNKLKGNIPQNFLN